MATSTGTLRGFTLMGDSFSGIGARKIALLTYDFPSAYTGASDSATITGVGAAIQALQRSSKTVTIRDACSAFPGKDTNAQLIYASQFTKSADTFTFNLNDLTGTELTTATASTGVGIIVAYDES